MEEVQNNNENQQSSSENIEDLLTQEDYTVEFETKKKKKKKRKKKKNIDDKEAKPKKSKKKLIILLSIIAFIIIVLLLFVFVFVPKIKLIGDNNIVVEYGKEYQDQGCEASFMGKDISDKIWYEGSVNLQKVGTYEITCKVRKNRMTVSKTRKVEIVDNTKPTIELTGETSVIVCPNKDYEEEGYIANDNYDGDLTDKVVIEKQDDKIIYKVTDTSNNEETAERTFTKEDTTAPVITLKGSKSTSVTVGNKFTDPGYTATDNCDEDLTSEVKVSGSVDTNTTGTYTLTYKVTDKSGNSATEERKVTVQKAYTKVGSSSSCGEPGVIYLTFDDGPSAATTPTILNTLKKYNVKATFFVIGTTGSSSDNLIKREYQEGHTIGLHTYTHSYDKVYKSSDAFWDEISKISNKVKNATGVESKLIRFPGGASNTVSRHYSTGIMTRLASEVLEKGYNYFDWNISSGDAGGTTDPNQVYKNVVNKLSKSRGNVVLMHDIKTHTMKALENIIKYGIENGYKFDVLNKNINCKQSIAN